MTYFKSDMDGLAKEREFLDDRMKRAPYPRIKLENGFTTIRVLPAYDESGRWYYRYGMHFGLPIENARKTWPCVASTDTPETCLFCERVDDYRNTAPELYSQFKAKTRTLFNAYVVGDEVSGCKVLEVGPSISRDIIDIAERENDPTDPEDGFGFIIEKRSTGPNARDVEYKVSAERGNSPIPEAAWELLDNLHPLGELIQYPAYEEQLAILEDNADAQAQAPADRLQPGAAESPETRQLRGATDEAPPARGEKAPEEPKEPTESVDETRARLRERLRGSRG